MKTYKWPADAEAAIRQQVLEGRSAAQIALTFPQDENGKTPSRSAVLGRCFKFGIRFAPEAASKHISEAARKNRNVSARTLRKRGQVGANTVPKLGKKVKLPADPPLPPDMPDTQWLGAEAVMALNGRCCGFPIGDPLDETFRYCCVAVEPGTRYCGYHKGVMFQPPRKKKKSFGVPYRRSAAAAGFPIMDRR